MDASTVALITALIQLAIKYVPEMVEQGRLAIALLTKEGAALTEGEKKTVMEASIAAHEALQKRCDEQLVAAEAAGITE